MKLSEIDWSDLSKWHCLDHRGAGRDPGEMDQQQLAGEYVRARTDLKTAAAVLEEAQRKQGACVAAVSRTEDVMSRMISQADDFVQAPQPHEFPRAAISLARAKAELEAANDAVTRAKDAHSAAQTRVDTALNALVATIPKTA